MQSQMRPMGPSSSNQQIVCERYLTIHDCLTTCAFYTRRCRLNRLAHNTGHGTSHPSWRFTRYSDRGAVDQVLCVADSIDIWKRRTTELAASVQGSSGPVPGCYELCHVLCACGDLELCKCSVKELSFWPCLAACRKSCSSSVSAVISPN